MIPAAVSVVAALVALTAFGATVLVRRSVRELRRQFPALRRVAARAALLLDALDNRDTSRGRLAALDGALRAALAELERVEGES